MKRFFAVLLALVLLAAVPALAEEEDTREDWENFDSRFGFYLSFPSDELTIVEEDWAGFQAECFVPIETARVPSGLICRGSRFSGRDWARGQRLEIPEPEAELNMPFDCAVYQTNATLTEEWIVSAADADYAFIIFYEAGDPEGWGKVFHSVLETLEFPSQPAVNDDFFLDFFQGGAAGMQFIDVVIDEDAEPITLVPYRDLNNFRLETLVWDDETFTVSEAYPIYTADPLAPGDNLNIYVYFEDMLPNLRIRYTDEEGSPQCFYLFESGRDGSLLLLTEDEL